MIDPSVIDPNLGDPGWLLTYIDLADRILAGSHPHIADVSPVYLWLMVALRFLGASVPMIRTLQLAMLIVGAAFCALAAKRLGGWVAAIAAAVLIVGNRGAWVVCAELDPKALIFVLTSAALWSSGAPASRRLAGRRPRRPDTFGGEDAAGPAAETAAFRDVAAGILLGLAAAAHPYGYVLLLIALIWSRSWRMAIAAILPIIAVVALSPVESHSSAQFYEGNNAFASGCAGATPNIVTELQLLRRDASPDPAYRLIAERAGGDPKRYWRDKALAFIREYPVAAAGRFATKALLTVHHFDVHDVVTAQRRSIRLARYPAIGFGVAFVLAVAAVVLSDKRRELLLPALFAIAMILLLTIFVVSARQRNVLLAPLAILAGVGVAEILALLRRRMEHALLAFGAVLIAAALLGIETAPMREYDHLWRIALRRPADPESPPRLFDQAIALERVGRWHEADAILASLGGYRPLRLTTAVSSVAYYRARAALAMGWPADAFIERALVEAPGDPHVLALRAAVSMDHRAARLLDELHDPTTRDRALLSAMRFQSPLPAAKTVGRGD
jgi:hypothetical protein